MSPEQFSRQASLWRSVTPMIEHVTRLFNAGASVLGSPVRSNASPDRNALIAETAYRLMANTTRREEVDRTQIEESARNFILSLPAGESATAPLRSHEWTEVDLLASNLGRLVATRPGISFEYDVDGCGVVTRSKLDALAGDEVVEVKTVQRQFRSADVRQALTYATLLQIQHVDVEQLTLVNPREARVSTMPMVAVAATASGLSTVELVEEIAQLMVGMQLSL